MTESLEIPFHIDSHPSLDGRLSSPVIDKICAALAKAQGQIGAVKKNGKNTFFNNAPYALYEDIVEAIQPVAAANGLATIRRFEENTMHTILVHESGQWIDYGRYNLGTFSKHQERGSAITYAKRYVDSGIFGVAPEVDDDSNAVSAKTKDKTPAPIPPKQKEPTPPLAPSQLPAKPKKKVDVILSDGEITQHESYKDAVEAISVHFSELEAGPNRLDVLEKNNHIKLALYALDAKDGGTKGGDLWAELVAMADKGV